jgi:hypothetical protein
MTNSSVALRQINPTGKSVRSRKKLSSPSRKNIPVASSGKSGVQLRPSTATRGAIAIVTTVRWDAMDAKAATDERGH